LGEANRVEKYYHWVADEERKKDGADKPDANTGKAKEVFNPGEWLEPDHWALQDAKSYHSFIASQRGYKNNKFNVKR
jgi:hypothetical protein